jgi:uncharacterized protein with von Willebrand factor type A (vWA) domain
VVVSASGPAGFVAALGQLLPRSRRELYWAARLTLVNRAEDLPIFDAVISALLADAVLGLDPPSRKAGAGGALASVPGASRAQGSTLDGAGLPWTTRPMSITAVDSTLDSELGETPLPDVLPSRLVARADEPFDRFDADDLRTIGEWLQRAEATWPRRLSLRRERHGSGKRIDLRATIKGSRTTGWQPMRLARTRRRTRPRPVVLVCDVSRSMQPYATIYLHLMRAAVLRSNVIRPEVFAFSTSLTRLTPVLSHRSAEVALARANDKVVDRYGGTHLGKSVAALLSAPHGNALRGAVVVIASDGWDSDAPDVLGHAMARVRRRAARVVWLNPRAASQDFQPLTGSMAAALPYCDVFMPAHSLTGLRALFDVLGSSPVARVNESAADR